MDRFLVDENEVVGAASHAIVIGVEAYPHLNGGRGPLTPRHDGMKQLTSPGVSARALASWLIADLEDPAKPLASVALLLSETNPQPFLNPRTGANYPVEEAIIANAKQALADWKARGAHPEDRLLFYFCGHGIGSGSRLALLLADFGCNEDNALEAAIDFNRFWLGMERCPARQQCFFIDACRTRSETVLGADGYLGDPIVIPDARKLPIPSPPPREAPIYYSTLLGQGAFARLRQPTPFASALLWALGGGGSDDNEGNWQVSTTGLKRAIDFSMDRAFEAGARRLQIASTDHLTTFYFHRLSGRPNATVFVGCRPEDATAFAELSYVSGGSLKVQRAPAPEDWELVLQTGQYEFIARFVPGAPYAGTARKQWYVTPPYRKVRLEVTP